MNIKGETLACFDCKELFINGSGENYLLDKEKDNQINNGMSEIAHDINNVLGGIIGNAELLFGDNRIPDDCKERIANIITSSNHASRLCKQIVSTRKEEKHLEIKPKNIVNVLKTFTTVNCSFRKGIKIELNHTKDILPVDIDIDEINRIFLNLLVNSADAMRNDGTVIIEITVVNHEEFIKNSEESKKKFVKISFKDSGVGIKKENFDKIFKPYFSTKDSKKERGLGLSNVKNMLHEIGGYINFESEVDVGTTFFVYLPLIDNNLVENDVKKEILTGKGQKVIIIDDEELIRDVCDEFLKRLNYNGQIVSSPDEAMKILETIKDIDVIITDLNMPGINVIDYVSKFKSVNPKIEVVVASGLISDISKQKLKDDGVKHFILKPFSLLKFSNILKEIFKKKE